MHESCCVELTHSRVNYRKASPALAPCFEAFIVSYPSNPIVFSAKCVTENMGEMERDVRVEISPIQLSQEWMFSSELPHYRMVHFPDRDGSELDVSR